jgi:glucan phosphoethanolaminetransferase (alkaline phosphatase superfamily)
MADPNPRYSMDVMNIRPWIFFYLICFVAILLAATFIVQGITILFWVSSTLIITVVGFNFILIFQEVREHNRKRALMKNFSQNIRKTKEPDQP